MAEAVSPETATSDHLPYWVSGLPEKRWEGRNSRGLMGGGVVEAQGCAADAGMPGTAKKRPLRAVY